MANDYHNRFKGADWYGIDVPILVGGAGGLGSWLVLLLCRMGLTKIGVYDADTIEAHNLSGQFFSELQIGKTKLEALKDNCRLFTGTEIRTIEQWYDEKSMRADYMFACFDNIEARKLMFEKWLLKDSRQLFVDIRLDFEQIDIFFVTKGKEEEYKANLFDDSEVEEPQCTMKQTTHIATLATSLAIAGFTNYLSTEEVRNVLFHQTYVVPLNYYTYDR